MVRRRLNNEIVDWTKRTDDLVIEIFSRLNNFDKGSLSSTCTTWRNLGSSSCLWYSLDVRAYKFDDDIAQSLSSRCMNLARLTFNDAQSPHPIMSLSAHNLKEIIGHRCKDIKDSTLSVIVAGHPFLQTLQLGPHLRKISSDAIRAIANCCPNLRKLKLSGIRNINEVAINALASYCENLTEIAFTDCLNINEIALGNLLSLRFLSVAGTKNMNWDSVSNYWRKLPNLVGLDISRTNVDETCIHWLLSSSSSLRVLCALDCPLVPVPTTFNSVKVGAKMLLRDANDMYQWMWSTVNVKEREEIEFRKGVFLMGGDKEMETMMLWLECVFSHSFLSHFKSNPEITSVFWCEPAAVMLFSFIKSKQEDVIEIGLETISNLIPDREGITTLHEGAVSAVGNWYEEIGLLLCYCKSHKESLQLQAIKAISSLLEDVYFYSSIARRGGIAILVDLTKSMSKLVTEQAARGLHHLSRWADCHENVTDAGGVEALVQVLSKWSRNEAILFYVAAALAKLAYYERCAMEIKRIDGVRAVLKLAFGCSFPLVKEQALRAVANLCRHGNKEHDFAGIGKRAGVFDSLVGFTGYNYIGIRVEAVAALSNLCCYEGHFKSTIAAGVIEAIVALARPGNSPLLQENAAAFLWKFSGMKENSIAIGEREAIAALIDLTRSNIANVRDNAVGALCSLAFLPCNAARIKAEGGVPVLIHFCNLTQSRVAKFYSTLALACMYDDRMMEMRINDYFLGGKLLVMDHIGYFILTVCDPAIFSFIAEAPTPSNLKKQAEALFISDAGQLESRDWVFERLVSLLRDSYCDIKACAAFALVQLIASHNINWMKHTRYTQEAGGPRILRTLAASKAASDSIKVLSKILLFCLEQNQRKMESQSNNNA